MNAAHLTPTVSLSRLNAAAHRLNDAHVGYPRGFTGRSGRQKCI